MLTFDWDNIKQNGLDLKSREDVSSWPELQALLDAEECQFLAPLAIEVHVYPVGNMLEVVGKFSTLLNAGCSRCLGRFSMDFAGAFELSLVKELPSVGDEEGVEIELSADDMGLTLVEEKAIDLKPMVSEQVILAFPYRVLCSEICKGVCMSCGADLNQQKCLCRSENPLNKFASLKDLKIQK